MTGINLGICFPRRFQFQCVYTERSMW
jgi:hypothetical protein